MWKNWIPLHPWNVRCYSQSRKQFLAKSIHLTQQYPHLGVDGVTKSVFIQGLARTSIIHSSPGSKQTKHPSTGDKTKTLHPFPEYWARAEGVKYYWSLLPGERTSKISSWAEEAGSARRHSCDLLRRNVHKRQLVGRKQLTCPPGPEWGWLQMTSRDLFRAMECSEAAFGRCLCNSMTNKSYWIAYLKLGHFMLCKLQIHKAVKKK